jgi:hypothetical protein
VVKHVGAPERYLGIVHDAVGKMQLGQNMRGLATIMTDPRSGRCSASSSRRNLTAVIAFAVVLAIVWGLG